MCHTIPAWVDTNAACVYCRAACVALYGAMLLYLSLGMTTTQYALRASLDLLWFGDHAPFTWTKQVH